MLDFPECWEPRVFSFKTPPQSVFDVLYMARWKNRKKKIRRSKVYLNSLLLSKSVYYYQENVVM